MKKTLTLLTTLFLTTSAFAFDLETFIDNKKEELVQKSEQQALNILKCDKNHALLDFVVNDNEWSCKFSTYTLKNIEKSGGFKISQSREEEYISSITKTEGKDYEQYKDFTIEDLIIEESLSVLYRNNYISFEYYNQEVTSLDKFETSFNESIFLPQTRTVDFSSNLSKDSFNISANEDRLLIFFWRGE